MIEGSISDYMEGSIFGLSEDSKISPLVQYNRGISERSIVLRTEEKVEEWQTLRVNTVKGQIIPEQAVLIKPL